MHRASAFVSENSRARAAAEAKYYILFAATQVLCGILLVLTPVFDKNGILILAAGWVLVAVLAFDVLRPFYFGRGVADAVMVFFTAAYYVTLGFAGGFNVHSIENFRTAVCIALFLAGISRVIAYARLVDEVNLPFMIACGFFEMAASVLLLVGWPGATAPFIYWVSGMSLVFSGFESITEAAKLSQFHKRIDKIKIN